MIVKRTSFVEGLIFLFCELNGPDKGSDAVPLKSPQFCTPGNSACLAGNADSQGPPYLGFTNGRHLIPRGASFPLNQATRVYQYDG